MLEDFSDAVVGFGRAFEVVPGADLLLDFFALWGWRGLVSSLWFGF